MSLAQYMYPIQSVSKYPHVLLLTLSRALYLRFGLPTRPLSTQYRISRINPQVLYHSHAVTTAKTFESV